MDDQVEGGPVRYARWSLVGIALALVTGYGLLVHHGPALADEFIYLGGARHFALTGSLDARYYDAEAIVRQGHPHQDAHAPGYVLILGAVMYWVRGTYWTAVGLNAAAYILSALLVRELGRKLGVGERVAWLSGALYLVLPAYLVFVYWAMAEVVLGTLFLLSLVAAARASTVRRSALAGLLFGATCLVRESALFGLPALLGLLPPKKKTWPVFLAAAVTFMLLVYLPLSRHRAAGGANFWAPTSGRAFGFQAVQAAQRGRLWPAVELATARAAQNLGELTGPQSTLAERSILLTYAALPALSLLGWKSRSLVERRYLAGLALGFLAMVAVLFGFYVIVQWSGYRYLMFMMPGFLPAALSGVRDRWPRCRPWLVASVVAGLMSAVDLGIFQVLDAFKLSRQQRQERIAAYVEKYVDTYAMTRVVLTNGWLFGLRHFPVEVISSQPGTGGGLRVLERGVWFDYLVLPGDSPLGTELDGRPRYRRMNPQEPEPPLRVYRRLK